MSHFADSQESVESVVTENHGLYVLKAVARISDENILGSARQNYVCRLSTRKKLFYKFSFRKHSISAKLSILISIDFLGKDMSKIHLN